MFILGSLESERRRQWEARGPGPLNKIWPPTWGLARHNERFTIEEIIHSFIHSFIRLLNQSTRNHKNNKKSDVRCQILRLKCTKSFVGWGSAPDPAGGAYSAPQTPYSWILGGLLLRGRERDERGRGGGEGRGRRGKEAAGSVPS